MAELTLTGMTPATWSFEVPINTNLVFTFSAPVFAGSGAIVITLGGQTVLSADIHSDRITISGNTVTLDPPADFLYGQDYRITIPAGLVVDADKVPLTAPGAAGFYTDFDPTPLNLAGTDGNDNLLGGSGNDYLDGRGGNDNLSGRTGDNTLIGGDGDDTLNAAKGNDVLDGGAGNDQLNGGLGTDRLLGGAGNDTLELGGTGTADGGDGDDTLTFYGSSATLDGGAGKDTFSIQSGSGGTANANGGEGDDSFRIQLGESSTMQAILSGGEGRDSYLFVQAGHSGHTITDFQPGLDTIDISRLVENSVNGNPFGPAGFLRMRQQGADVQIEIDEDGAAGSTASWHSLLLLKNVSAASLTAADFSGQFWPDGRAFNTPIQGTAGNEEIHGSPMPEVIAGGAGNDSLWGERGDDQLSGDGGNDFLYGGLGNDILNGGDGDDWLDGQEGDDTLQGGAGDDHLSSGAFNWYGPAGYNILDGGDGNDVIEVTGGTGKAIGGAGIDGVVVKGGNVAIDTGADGDRIIVQAADADITATGGTGQDRYEFAPTFDKLLIITDFETGAQGDVIDPYTALANPPQTNIFGNGQLRLQQQGNDTLVQLDRDGTAGPDNFHTLAILRNVQAGNLTRENFAYGIDLAGGNDALAVTGSAGNDRISGYFLNDRLEGMDGNDELFGGVGNDVLLGGNGNDLLVGGAGDDTLDGGAGLDTASYTFGRNYATIVRENGSIRITGKEGTDTLTGVERLHFVEAFWDTATYYGVAYDVDGNAGTVYRLYQAAFDRKPDGYGYNFWLGQYDKGISLGAIAGAFIDSDEFRALYGANPTNAEFVTRLYHNILHREPEEGGYTFWNNVLDKNLVTRAEVLYNFSESKENVAAVAAIIGDSISWQY
jgi:Ca2+-binding RTX toxin-like protein